jgi:endonuclease/exonuclease/phosphatase family metal-dependent hydrolase
MGWLRSISPWLVAGALALCACGSEDPFWEEPGWEEPGWEETVEEAPREIGANEIRLRVVAANLSSGLDQSYTGGAGSRILKGLRADVALLQEFNYQSNSAADLRAFVDATFGPDFSFSRGVPAQIPNAVVSRYPVVASGHWDDSRVSNRDFEWARIDIPGPTDLWAVSVHLLTTGATERAREAQSLVNYIKRNVPANDHVVIAGDFNTSSRTETSMVTLSQVVVTSPPYPADRRGGPTTNRARTKAYDWVVASPSLHSLRVSAVIGTSTFPSGLVADTRVYSPISELSPALATDSGTQNMQHMAVVRDFGIPALPLR